MSDFFQCDCIRHTLADHVKWCNRTAHEEFMRESDHDGCDGHDRDGEDVHCTDYGVDVGDVIRCTICEKTWVHRYE